VGAAARARGARENPPPAFTTIIELNPGGLDLVKSSALRSYPGGLDLVKSSALRSYYFRAGAAAFPPHYYFLRIYLTVYSD
jgi:hypothetical protein